MTFDEISPDALIPIMKVPLLIVAAACFLLSCWITLNVLGFGEGAPREDTLSSEISGYISLLAILGAIIGFWMRAAWNQLKTRMIYGVAILPLLILFLLFLLGVAETPAGEGAVTLLLGLQVIALPTAIWIFSWLGEKSAQRAAQRAQASSESETSRKEAEG